MKKLIPIAILLTIFISACSSNTDTAPNQKNNNKVPASSSVSEV